MIGSGTGIAPFRAFIQHIYQENPDWHGYVWLFYGALSGMEKLYQNVLNNDLYGYYGHKTFQAFEGLSYSPWIHGEDSGLTHVLEENARQIWELIQNPLTRIYICGLSKMVQKFEAILIKTAGSEARWRWTQREMIAQKRWSKLLFFTCSHLN
jgi:ferredoxin--NADP+ reductase